MLQEFVRSWLFPITLILFTIGYMTLCVYASLWFCLIGPVAIGSFLGAYLAEVD